MKVVLFCGGLGMRMRDYSDAIPKPMVTIGSRPILWHLMRYYAHFGHRDFILCLGYMGDSIKEYFSQRDETGSGAPQADGEAASHGMDDIEDWNITMVDTGASASIGERLSAAEPYLEGEQVFLANYSDGLTDLDLPSYVDFFLAQDRTAAFVAVKSPQMFHVVDMEDDGSVSRIASIGDSEVWINGGFFVFRNEIFRYIREGEDLVTEPFQRLIAERQLLAYKYTGFWEAMDTFKDRQSLAKMDGSEAAPWKVWRTTRPLGDTTADAAR